MTVTRFGLEGYGVRRVAFSPKPPAGVSGRGLFTRFGLEGYGVRRVAFSPKPDGSGGGGGVVELHFLPIQVTAGRLKCF